jgi:alginate biosynthesis protein AlgX
MRSIPFLVTATLLFSAPAFAEGPYTCPDLMNKEKTASDQMTQGKDGWFFRINRDLNSPLIITPEVEQLFARFAAALERRGTTLVLVPVPPRAAIAREFLDTSVTEQAIFSPDKALANYRHITQALGRVGVLMPNLLETDPLPFDMPEDKPFFFRRDHHWTPWGARAVAQKIGEAVKATSIYASLTPATYVTRMVSESGWKPSMALEIQRLCTDVLPPEPFQRFETRLEAGNDADALFGDAGSGTSSVLVGSSFSALPEYNFDGFLMEATGLEIANRAISAGMQFNAVTSYTSSPAFEAEVPPYLIWEIPNLAGISQSALTMFRQIIPTTHGACTTEKAVATRKVSIKNGQAATLLTLSPQKKVAGNNYYMFITTPNLGLAKFTLQFEYDDGDGEWFTVDRSQHFENTGRFFVELSDEIEGNLTSVTIDGLPITNADLEVRLCQASQETKAAPAAN